MAELKQLNQDLVAKTPEVKEELAETKPIITTSVEMKEESSEPEHKMELSKNSEELGELTSTEQKAMEFGWTPKDQYKGDPKDFVDAQTYIERGLGYRDKQIKKISDKLEEESRKNEEYQRMVKELVTDIKNVEARERAKVLAELERKKQEAEEANDYRGVKAAEEKLAEYAPKKVSEENDPAIDWFKKENQVLIDGLNKDPIATAIYEDGRVALDSYIAKNKNISKMQQLQYATKYMQTKYADKYPDYFPSKDQSVVKTSIPKVSSNQKPSSGGKASNEPMLSEKELTDSQRMIYEKAERYGLKKEDCLKLWAKQK